MLNVIYATTYGGDIPTTNNYIFNWNHVVYTMDVTTGITRLYINGVFYAEATISQLDTWTDPLYIGNNIDNSLFTGYISSVRIYNRVLT